MFRRRPEYPVSESSPPEQPWLIDEVDILLIPPFLERHPKVRLRFSMSAGLADLAESRLNAAIRMRHRDDPELDGS
ncbi:hypothetical protein [Amaricoccus macauensis]|uniref:hypothetical protein n=1 Tax=Amaricoccus macauensis TaxID=57001 RepID=UPI003C7A271A